MKKIILFIFLTCISAEINSQNSYYTVSGKIIDSTTHTPMQAASVFAQNTTIGTATDAEGNFKLLLPNGGYDLVITFTGYQTESKRITTADADNKNIIIALKQKEKAMEDVVIKSTNEVKDGWQKYGDFFIENFIGKTANSSLCTIKNKDAIKFYYSKKRNRLKVLAEEPIQMDNDALGYTIKYSLDSFTYEYNTQVSLYTGYPLFEEKIPTTESQRIQWNNNRMLAYNGSILHLMRSIYNKQVKEEGFEIQVLVKEKDNDTALTLKNLYGAINYNKDDSLQTVEIFPNRTEVAVIYNKAIPDTTYIIANPNDPSKFQLSVFSFTPNESIVIEQNGYYYEQASVIINQYLAWKRMSDMLPYDFKTN
ncbi:MAG: carboxypeptidase-like regulatory domain-containing protein [Ferruginibacter sp.]